MIILATIANHACFDAANIDIEIREYSAHDGSHLVISFPDLDATDVMLHVDNDNLVIEAMDVNGHKQMIVLEEGSNMK